MNFLVFPTGSKYQYLNKFSIKTNHQNIAIYAPENGEIEFSVNFDKDSVWLSLNQISELFNKDKSVISRHIRNVFKEGELNKKATVAKNATVQKEGNREITRDIEYYNLDIIISVGYRTKSKEGTKFRIWATQKLKEHLVNGFTENKNRLDQLQKTIQLVQRTAIHTNNLDENKGLLDVLSDYTRALDILDDYDHQKIVKISSETSATFKIGYQEAKTAIERLRDKFGASSLFGNEKDESFKSSIAVIDQTFDSKELYTSIEEKAANLLYLVVKNHSFTDGNKRIAAWLFVWYLNKNMFLYTEDGGKKISNNTLVAVTLMIAESSPSEKEVLISVIVNLLNTKE